MHAKSIVGWQAAAIVARQPALDLAHCLLAVRTAINQKPVSDKVGILVVISHAYDDGAGIPKVMRRIGDATMALGGVVVEKEFRCATARWQ